MSKKVKIAIIIASVVLLAVAIIVYVKVSKKEPVPSPSPKLVQDIIDGFPKTGTVETESTQLNVRKSPGEADGLTNKSTAIDCLNNGEKVTIQKLSDNKAWGYVESKGGWVSMKYINLASNIQIFDL